MRYKSRVQQIVDNLDNQVSNLIKRLENGDISGVDTLGQLRQTKKNIEAIENLVRLEEDDFERTENQPAPGSVDAPTPKRQSRRTPRNTNTRRVEQDDLNEKNTKRVDTEGGHERKKKTTERVEFD